MPETSLNRNMSSGWSGSHGPSGSGRRKGSTFWAFPLRGYILPALRQGLSGIPCIGGNGVAEFAGRPLLHTSYTSSRTADRPARAVPIS